ncbi:MAG: hypothetical protein R2873_34585 [Caldilineaceae bacterium]
MSTAICFVVAQEMVDPASVFVFNMVIGQVSPVVFVWSADVGGDVGGELAPRSSTSSSAMPTKTTTWGCSSSPSSPRTPGCWWVSGWRWILPRLAKQRWRGSVSSLSI